MLSGAGEAENRRRRDFTPFVSPLSLFCLLLGLLPPFRLAIVIHRVSIFSHHHPLSRFRSAQIPPEEYSHLVSLMARDFPLGPSDAPFLVESSTAHGGSFFWVVFSWISECASSKNLVRNITSTLGFSRRAPIFGRPMDIFYWTLMSVSSSDEAFPMMYSHLSG